MTSPLTDLTKKDSFKCDEKAEKAFQKIKEVMSSCPILALLDFSKPFVVECDASGGGIGVVLKQGQHPIAFERINLEPHEKFTPYMKKNLGHHVFIGQVLTILHRKQVCGEN